MVLFSSSLTKGSNFAKADVQTLSRVHSADYIRFIHELDKQVNLDGKTVPFTPKVQKHIKQVDETETKDVDDCDTSFSKGSLSAARRAVGAVCHAVDRVLSVRQPIRYF
jgi:acetoin utilization deacetylase AcuC-like enzyme